jgi:hypothetical protein
MLIDPHDRPVPLWFQVDIPTSVSLLVVAGILLISIVLSVTAAEHDKRSGKQNPKSEGQNDEERPKSEIRNPKEGRNPKPEEDTTKSSGKPDGSS